MEVMKMGSRLTLTCVCLVVASLIFTVPGFAKIDPEDIVGIWLLDDGIGAAAKDSSDSGNDGEIFGAEWIDGKFGEALQFDGVDDHVDMLDVNNIPTESDPRSITVWFYTEVSGGTYKNNISSIVQQAEDSNGAGKFFCVAPRFYPDTGTETIGLWGNSRNVLGADGEIELDRWNFAAVTYDGTTTKVYINGEERMSGTPALNTNGAHKSNFYIARRNDSGWNGVFNGIVDEVGLFKRALTAGEIKDIMNRGLARAALGLAAVSSSGKLATKWGLLKNQ
jgi:hypothetical protein